MLKGKYIRTKVIRQKQRKKMLGISGGFLGKKHTKISKQKIKDSHLGKKHSEITRQKIRKSHLGKKREPFTELHRQHIGEVQKGEKSHFWKGGISKQLYSQNWTDNLRESIRQRDDYVCQICGIHQDELDGWNKRLDIHHKDYNKNNLNPNNLITLCRKCHIKTNFDRDYWIKYF